MAVGLVALAIGILAGVALSRDDGSGGAEEIQAELFSAAGSVEVAGIEYEEAVAAGGDITIRSEYAGARDALESGRARYLEVRESLASLAPERVDALDEAFDEAEGLMADAADSEAVQAALERLEGLLKGSSG